MGMALRETLRRRIDAAMGRIPADLVIKNVEYLDVFQCEWKRGDVAVIDGTIVGLESGLSAARTIDGKSRSLVPGFVDAHVHVESSLLLPENFERAILPKGTTTAICDPHELANVEGISGIEFFLNAAENLSLDLRVMLSSCVPATHLETNGGGTIGASQLRAIASHPKALGLAEMMNMPGVIGGDEAVLDKLATFQGRPIDGHCPLLSGQALSAYASAGIASCHESTQLGEAIEKLSKGISVWIREGSVAKDLNALAPLLTMARSTSIGFCTDDRNPWDIAQEGHIDFLVRSSIKLGAVPEIAYRSASWSVARHYGLRGVGAIAPGYAADFILLDDKQTCAIHQTFKGGRTAEECIDASLGSRGRQFSNSVRAQSPLEEDLAAPTGRVHVIEATAGSILTQRSVASHDDRGVAKLCVLERYGKRQKPANGYVRGFGENFRGAIASSVGHDSHNLICVGSDATQMRTALAALIVSGGGFCVVKDNVVLAQLALPCGGLMSKDNPSQVREALGKLHDASRAVGCELPEPFLQLAFLSLPVIPSLKLTDRGLVDVEAFKIIDVRAA